ncbi:prolyl oligopeptidase family serine peptidase [Leptospira bandrabouensis]|uniref:alpha/beta hydrolase family esterase n=1 Tax=Leptospira bandrabouensis TaxID=2484903 RepID=UPI001EE90BB2|nr:PHB depolymerase family esterase [Leptospira bandrabouensis]MCG6143397.1 prolyl oligopeptidase family serine peptidase [Leptospira bandrabouensis]MCG6159057.1 prolyl oligopeptidase family serine peptidase [Leptospira bandrabouensis]MCG6162991.1 prolyl oligopeptidase family serine peptidase [Leptospira bandrabouensis]MCW7458158.1 prolyl oligopeptidase family serine peptidase [Leptospira bandrabouensis]MCW7476820.1 prolyl oligopeptidase family serine peptidase [Leptospira bandrabouensis]
MRLYFVLTIVFFIFSCMGLSRKLSPNEKLDFLEIQNNKRTYIVHYPKKWDGSPIPMLVALHGRFGSGFSMIKQTKLDILSDTKGFVVVFPDGFKRSWADGRGNTPADQNKINDVVFIESIVKRLVAEGSVNPKEIYLVGHSNGGFMAQRLAVEKPELWKGVVSVAAQLSVFTLKRKLNLKTKPVSVGIIAGTDDPLVPYSGGYVRDGGEILSVDDSINRWKEWNSCNDNLTKKTENFKEENSDIKIDFLRFEFCAENSKVGLIQLNGLGHSWPGETPMIPFINQGKTTKVIDGSKLVWDFMEAL